MKSFFDQFFNGRILHTADDLAVCKSFDAEIHKIDPCLYFVLIVLSRGVGNADISKIGCKVWIYKGEVLNSTLRQTAPEAPRRERRNNDRRRDDRRGGDRRGSGRPYGDRRRDDRREGGNR